MSSPDTFDYRVGDVKCPWEAWVGNQPPREFMDNTHERNPGATIEDAVAEYVTRDHEFFADMSDDELDHVHRQLVAYIEQALDQEI